MLELALLFLGFTFLYTGVLSASQEPGAAGFCALLGLIMLVKPLRSGSHLIANLRGKKPVVRNFKVYSGGNVNLSKNYEEKKTRTYH